MSPLDADPGVVTVLVAAALLGYHVAVEPWWGRAVYARLVRLRPHDPGALIAFARLTVGVQVAATAAVVLVVLVDPGVAAGSIGLTVPTVPDDAPPALAGVIGGMLAGLVVLTVLGIRAARRGRAPVAPAAFAAMIPVTRTERWWMAAVSVGAGVSEELVFRGLLLAVAVGSGVPPLLAAAVLTVVFGAVHLYQGWAGMLSATVLGAVMFAITLGTGSLLIPIVLHAAIDLRGLLLTRPAAVPQWARTPEG